MLSKRVRLYLALVLALIAVATTVNFAFASNSAADGQSVNSVDATAAATVAAAPTLIANFPLCQPPTPTPAPTATKGAPATKVATAAATAAAPAATMAATAAMMPATMAPTAVATMVATAAPATPVPPTATPIVIGKKPAYPGLRVIGTKNWLLKGAHCISVAETVAGGPADIAGIQKGDLVLGFDKDALKDATDFEAHVNKHLSGDVVVITVQRGTKAMSIKVTLGLNPFA